VIERNQKGTLQIKDSFDAEAVVATGGGLVGTLLGTIGGPYGVLLGLPRGALGGGSSERSSGRRRGPKSKTSRSLAVGSTVGRIFADAGHGGFVG
jgi:hypothetical protein